MKHEATLLAGSLRVVPYRDIRPVARRLRAIPRLYHPTLCALNLGLCNSSIENRSTSRRCRTTRIETLSFWEFPAHSAS